MTLQSSHDTVSELLPWYANATLSPEESAVVEQHLESCIHCRQELRVLREMAATMSDDAENAPPVESSLAKTLSAIDALQREENRPPARFNLFRWLSSLWSGAVPPVRLVLAAQLGAILLLGVLLILSRQHEPSFTTLSGGSDPTARGARLTLIFSPNITEDTMRKLLLDTEATIVSGPSAQGVYVVELSGKPVNDPAVDAVIDTLRKKTDAVRFVEREP
jgi:hypothetical protein